MTCLGCELENQRMQLNWHDQAVCLTETISRVSAVIDKIAAFLTKEFLSVV